MKIYLIVCIGMLVLGGYWCGLHVGQARCQMKFAHQTHIVQTKTIQKMETINAETNRTAVHDIRRILREKYTISE